MRVLDVFKRVFVLILIAGWVSSCGSQKLISGQKQMRVSFSQGDYAEAEHIADSLKKVEAYKEKDRVLYALETGTIDYFQGDYDASVQSFSNAETYIDQFFSKSASQGVKAFLTNDTQLAYNGEVYEDVYLNGFKSLSYLEMNEIDKALVEARRIVQKLGQAEQKYGGLAESYSEADTTEREGIEWQAGTSKIHDSPFGRYLSSALYAKSGDQDDADIELQKLKGAISNHQALADSELEFDSAFAQVNKPQTYNTILTAFCGEAPNKVENNLEINDVGDQTGLKIAIPKLKMRPSNVERIEVMVNDTMMTRLPIIEEMDKVARETFKIKKPIIVARATVRGILKSVSQDAAADAAEEEGGELVGEAVNILAGAAREASERADLRGWQTMPGKVYTNTIELPAGNHTLAFKYYGAQDTLLHTDKKEVEMTENEQLEPVASIYTN